jgi:predicted RNA-binding protein with PIN domain
MRTLIDGYNVMYAAGLMGKRFGHDGLRRARTRFLNDLHTKLGPVEAHLTTVVFDASKVPDGLPAESRHKGISLVFAIDQPTADERIDELIRSHPDPKRLTVISSDNQVRASARRRGAISITVDDFLMRLGQADRPRVKVVETTAPEKPTELSESEAAYWAREFGEVERSGELKAAFGRDAMFPSDEEIARIEREVEREFREGR